MSKNKIIIVLLIMLSISVISLYTTFGYEGNNLIINESNSDYNFLYSLKENTNKEITVEPQKETFIDIILTNTYESAIKYGMYYYLITPEKLPENIEITLAKHSQDILEDIIKPQNTKVVSIKITNNSDYTINLIQCIISIKISGGVIGFC